MARWAAASPEIASPDAIATTPVRIAVVRHGDGDDPEPGALAIARAELEARLGTRLVIVDVAIEALPGEPAKRPFEIAMKCLANGLYVRYGGDTIQLAPPFISEKPELDRLISILGDAINATA